jgi:DNA topoisomerase-3
MAKLLATGKTDLLDKFVSMRTRRAFKAYLSWDAEAGKVNFEFEPRASKFPPRKTAGAASAKAAGAKSAAKAPPVAEKATAKAAKSVLAKKAAPAAKKATATKAPAAKKTGAGLKPSPELAAVVGAEPIARTEVIKKIWDYIKAHGLQDKKDKRAINADAKLKPLFGKNQVSMFELAGIVGKHLSAQ